MTETLYPIIVNADGSYNALATLIAALRGVRSDLHAADDEPQAISEALDNLCVELLDYFESQRRSSDG